MEEIKKDEVIETNPEPIKEEPKIEETRKEEVKQAEPLQQPKQPVTEKSTQQPVKDEKNGLCIASMVLGIISIVCILVWFISVPCAILAIIFGCIGHKSSKKGMAIAGIVTGSISAVLMILLVTFLFTFGLSLGIMSELDDYDTYTRNTYRHYNSRYYDDYE